MDRLDTLAIFVAVAEEGSFVAAARRLHRSPAAVTRAVAALEDRLATRLLNRTTRAVALTDAGVRYLDQCRRALAEFEELELSAAGEHHAPKGLLTITAPEMFGRLHVLPIAQTFMHDYPSVEISMLLLDRMVSLIDEGVDVGIRIAHLPDSSLRAIHVGNVRQVTCASPAYLAKHGIPKTPEDLAHHQLIAVAAARSPAYRWSFKGPKGVRTIAVKSRLSVNSVQAALEAAAQGAGIAQVLSYQAATREITGEVQRILEDTAPAPIPIHIIYPAGRHLPPKSRLFIDRAAAILREKFG